MTKEEARKFLVGKKVFVKNKGKEVQDKLFEIGFGQDDDSTKRASYLTKPFLFICKDMTLAYGDNVDYFYKDTYKEISAEDILKIKIEHLPKTWEEYDSKYFIINPRDDFYVNRQYKAHEKLLQLRDYYRNGWKPKDCELRWIITPIGSGFYIASYYNINRFLSFQSKEIAEEFLKNFKDLIIQAGDFI